MLTLRLGAAFWEHTDNCKACGETLCSEGRRILEGEATRSVKSLAEAFAPPDGKAKAQA